MLRRTLSIGVLTAILLLAATAAFAQTTSTISGTVTSDGSPLPGVTVTISSPQMQGTRTAVTGEAGGYSFNGVPPGTYTVRFELSGMQTVTKKLSVGVSQVGSADASMKMTGVSEAITVTASAPSVLETPSVSQNVTGKMMETLPVAQLRSPINTAALAPGVNANTPSASQLSISGSPGYDNTVMVNGVVITETVREQALPLYIEDAIQETTVLTGAISAEFGRFTGGVVNSITKSGGNEFSGSLRDQISSPRWTSRTPLQKTANTVSRHFYNKFYSATLGGFIMKDRLWFFGAGRKTKTDTPGSLRKIPGTTTSISYDRTDDDKRYEGKLTAQPFEKHNLTFSYLKDDSSTQNRPYTATSYDLAQLSNRTDPINFKTLFYNGILTNNWLVEGSWSKLFYGIGWGSGSQYTDFIRGTIVRNRADGNARYNSPTFCGVCDKETRNNDSWGVKTNYFLSSKSVGNMNIVGGVETFREHRYANNYQSGSNYRLFVNSVQYINGVFYPTLTPGTGSSAAFLFWTPIFTLQQGQSNLETKSAFVNDRWDLNSRWSFNLGLRYDKNHTVNADGTLNANDSKLAPRLSATYNLTEAGTHRLIAGYSQYVSRVSDGVATSNAAGGSPASIYYAYQGPAINPAGTPTDKLIDTATALQMVHDWLVSFCGGELSATNPCIKDLWAPGGSPAIPGYSAKIGKLSSPYVREIMLGYGAQWMPSLYTRVDLVSRDWKNFYSSTINSTTPQLTDPYGIQHDVAIIGNTNLIARKYRGVQFQTSWRHTRYSAGMNYTYSTLKGNDEQETSNNGTVGNYPGQEYYPELRSFANYQPTGWLSQDERHRGRVWFGYDVPIPSVLGNLNASVLQNFDSGTPYSALGSINLAPYTSTLLANSHYVGAPTTAQYYFSKRGEYRYGSITSTNLALNWERPIGRVALLIHAYMNNVFNQHTVNNVVTTVNASGNSSTFAAFNPFTETPKECPQGTAAATCKAGGYNWQKSSTFGTAASNTAFQDTRQYYFNFGVRF